MSLEMLYETMLGVKCQIVCQTTEGTKNIPALVSREVRPDSLEKGQYRITLFDQDLDPKVHINFNCDANPSTEAIGKTINSPTVKNQIYFYAHWLFHMKFLDKALNARLKNFWKTGRINPGIHNTDFLGDVNKSVQIKFAHMV